MSPHQPKVDSFRLLSPEDEKAHSKKSGEFDLLQTVHAPEKSHLDKTPHPPSLTPTHALTVALEPDSLTVEKFTLYEKYQRLIHHEHDKKITPQSFERFLCSSPFRHEKLGDGRETGSFHQVWRIDGVLVAFGVLDLLPNTVSSVYFVYDPDAVGKFGMGKVSALREVALCIEGGYEYYQLGNPHSHFGG